MTYRPKIPTGAVFPLLLLVELLDLLIGAFLSVPSFPPTLSSAS
jgi:hypothetical protein